MRQTLRNTALAGVMAVVALSGLGTTSAHAQGFGVYPGVGPGIYPGVGYTSIYNVYPAPPVVVGGFGGYYGGYNGFRGGYGGYGGGYGGYGYHHHRHYRGCGHY